MQATNSNMNSAVNDMFVEYNKVCGQRDRLQEELDETKKETSILKVQVSALGVVQGLAQRIVNATATCLPARRNWIRESAEKILQEMCNVIVYIKDLGIKAWGAIKELALKICNFIYDHLDEIFLITMGVVVSALVVAVPTLLITCGTMSPMVPMVAAAPTFIDTLGPAFFFD